MTASRDKEKENGAGADARPEVSAELSEQVRQFCLQARKRLAGMHERLQAQQRELLARLSAGKIQ